MDSVSVAAFLDKWVYRNRWIPHLPFTKQMAFLSLTGREALYGGAAAGGKSDALLMAALMFVDVPNYNAILFRKSYADLNLPEAIMARSHEWLGGTVARWNGADYRWTFPSGATLSFGYLAHDKDKFRYQSSAFQFIGWDELTQFQVEHYLYLFSRLRRLEGVEIPLRVRGATNPGGLGHDWVMDRFIVPGPEKRTFIAAKVEDNPFVDVNEYRKSLSELDETTRQQLEDGLWITDPEGKPFREEWWRGQNRWLPSLFPQGIAGRYLSWDTALTDKVGSAFTAMVCGEINASYQLDIKEVWEGKPIFPELPDIIAKKAQEWNRDGNLRGVIIEGHASGKPAIQTLRASSDPKLARSIIEFAPKGSKEERAGQAGIWCKRGLVNLPHPSPEMEWLPNFERQLFNFPETRFKDQVDSFSQLIIYLENFLVTAWHGIEAKRKVRGRDSRVSRVLGTRID